jgi:SAM-dependent methyltransferase
MARESVAVPSFGSPGDPRHSWSPESNETWQDRRVPEYGFDASWSDERRRLALIERCWDPMSTGLLTHLGVSAGWRCLDIGPGGGSISRWLRDQVGHDGQVVALDLDTRFVEDEPGIEARQGDVLTDDLEQDTFDLVHCRLLLHHLRGRQVEAVTRMAQTLRPGGILVASECYLGAMRASPTHAFAELWRGLYAAMPNADYEWAVSLPATLRAAGLAEIQLAGNVDLVRGGTPEAEFWRLTVEAVRERMPEDIDIDAGLAVLNDPDALEPGFIWHTAWGRRT